VGFDSPIKIALLLLVLVLVFGAKRLPEMGRSLGGGMREFKDAVSGKDRDEAEPPKPPLDRPGQPD
jgi:sec-independent protein translocase protein TatA